MEAVEVPGLGRLVREVVGTEKRRTVQYALEGRAKFRSSEAVEAHASKKKVALGDEALRALALLNFDPSVSTRVGGGEAPPAGAAAGGGAAAGDGSDSDFEPTPSQRAAGRTKGKGRKVAEAEEADEEMSAQDTPSREAKPSAKKPRKEGGGAGKRPRQDAAEKAAAQDAEPEWKRRNREIAQSRAAAFARGSGFKDDADREQGTAAAKKGKQAKKPPKGDEEGAEGSGGEEGGEGAAAGGAGGERESWPGPWSTASDLYRKRDAAAQKRKQGAAVESAPSVDWAPKPGGKARAAAPRQAPSLQDICIDFLATNIACVDSLGGILPSMKAKLCAELCRRRKLMPDVLPMFTEEGETSVLHLPDCSYLGETELAQAVQRIKGPALEEFSLKYCGRGVNDTLIDELCTSCPNITVLALGGCYRVTDKGVAAAVKHLTRLRVLELSSCTRISSEALRSLASAADTLECLSLANSTQLRDSDLQELSALKSLRRLDLSGCRGVTDEVITTIVRAFGGTLEELDVSHTPDSGFTQEPLVCRVTDEGLAELARGCPKLRSVTLRCCDSITDEGVTKLAAGCRYLTKLDLAKCKSLTNAGVEAIARSCVSLEWLSLDAAGRDELPDEEDGGGDAKYGITDESLLALEKHNGRTLTHLDLSWCRGVSDEALGFTVDRSPELRKLVLRGCSQITDVFMNGHSNENLVVWGRWLQDSTLAVRKRIHAL